MISAQYRSILLPDFANSHLRGLYTPL